MLYRVWWGGAPPLFCGLLHTWFVFVGKYTFVCACFNVVCGAVSAALFFEFAKERHSQEAIEFWLGVENARLPVCTIPSIVVK